ncbi:MAG TPA: redox-sensitive transcriptional activator SoxR [Frankiaceae bacterium]|nr:redox-sensitive transcriptional activator SoxR [Frankiaceae bacterium]
MAEADLIPIGELAQRAGVATSALRFYEQQGLISSVRTAGGQRRYRRAELRRVSFVLAAQRVGVPLADVRDLLASLPAGRTPTKRDWARLSTRWRRRLDERIAALEALRENLTDCIGCGCLSLRTCALFNPADAAATRGAGPRYLLGDRPRDVLADSARREGADAG